MSKYVNLIILAVTRMLNEICVAGIDEPYNWLRPVRPYRLNLMKSDIFQNDKRVIENYNIVRFLPKQKLNNTPHSEDFVVDWSYQPTVIEKLDHADKKNLFNRIDETKYVHNIHNYLLRNNRSLVLLKPDKIFQCQWINSFNNRYKPRILFEFKNKTYNFSCTDLKWRAFGRSENKSEGKNLLNTNNVYFVIGLTRKFRDEYWPMVVGVHILPDIEIDIDYSNL